MYACEQVLSIWVCSANKIVRQNSPSLIVQGPRMTEISMAKPICGRTAARNVQGLVAAIFWAAAPHGILGSVDRLNEHSTPVLAANRLCTTSDYSETWRVCSVPIVVVQSNGKVTHTERIQLRTTIHRAFAAMCFNHFKAVRPYLTRGWTGKHSFMVLWAKWVNSSFSMNHNSILSIQKFRFLTGKSSPGVGSHFGTPKW